MSKDVFLNPSLSVESITPVLDDDTFSFFLKTYYEWLQTTRIDYENASSTFTNGEEIVGQISRARATIRQLGNNFIVVKCTTNKVFDSSETIVGQTSGASATILSIKDNVIRQSSKIFDNRTAYKSVDVYFEYLKDELNNGMPSNISANRRFILNKFISFFKSKGTEEAYRFLFSTLYNETIQFRYPGEEILRVSDGKFRKVQILRVQEIDQIFEFINQTIVGDTSSAVANVIDIKTTFLGGIRYAELTLNLVSGVFVAGETIRIVGQIEGANTLTYGVVGKVNIIDGGSGYSVGDSITIVGDGSEAVATVSSVNLGSIDRLKVNSVGYGYRLGTRAIINNTSTGGSNLVIEVTEISNSYAVTSGNTSYTVGEISKYSVLNKGSNYFAAPTITVVDSVISSLGLLHENLITITNAGSDYAVGDTLTFSGGSGSGAAGQVSSVGNTAPYGEENVLFEDGTILLQEQSLNGFESSIKSEDWTNTGPILRIELSDFGTGYESANLPTLTIESANTVSGTNAAFTVNDIQGVSANVEVDIANNSVGIGSIRSVTVVNPGINYTNAVADATSIGDGNANLSIDILGLFISDGEFINDDGKIDYRIIQDSFFYQDFSYVIRSGLVIDAYKELVKKTIHPAGLEIFNEILIFSYILAAANFTSQVNVEKAPPIEVIIKKIISLFSLGFEPRSVVEVDVELSAVGDPVFAASKEINVEIAPIEIDSTVDVVQSPILSFLQLESQTTIESLSAEYEINVLNYLNINNFNQFSKNDFTFGELQISTLANDQIALYSSNTLLDVYGSKTVTKNVKINGTVSISGTDVFGTNTSFDTDFALNSGFIVNDEKFLVKNVANSQYMEINVNPIGSYTNTFAYKEIVV